MEVCLIHFLLVLAVSIGFTSTALGDPALKVLSFNIWGGGLHQGKSLEDTVAAIRATGADIIGLQEVHDLGGGCASQSCADHNTGLACRIARALDYHCHEQAASVMHGLNAVLSRFPIIGQTNSGLGVRIAIGENEVTLFNLHLDDAPYQPYQLVRIAYANAPFLTTEAQAVAAATAARSHLIDQLEQDLSALGDAPVMITGDFNEPSFRDWTARAVSVGRHPIPVTWPTTLRIEALGFTDTYRAVFPDEIAHPGFTWTTLPGEKEHHDRIDFVFARGPGLRLNAAAVVGERSPEANLVITPWPSDHRAVLAVMQFGTETRPGIHSNLVVRGSGDR
jgi:exodeoxyribonuclease III